MIGMESIYFKSIVSIRDKNDNSNVPLTSCKIQKISSTYSNTKIPIYKLIIDNKSISRNNSYLVLYTCQTCNIQNEITLNLFMRKVNKETKCCESCKNSQEIKCKNQSQFMKDNIHKIRSGEYINEVVKVKSNSLEEHLKKSKEDWDLEDENFKEHYFLHHLTDEDYTRVSCKIISISNDKIIKLNDWNYFPTYRIYNQSRFTPMLVHKTENRTEKPNYIKFKCDICECEYVHRDLEIVKNHLKLLCQQCSLVNKKFHLRKKTLNDGTSILWQSVPERRFIEWCQEKQIKIKNGPVLPYSFKETIHKYRVDFELPDKKVLVEIKDNHCWHREEQKTGKFRAKELSATEWCKTHEYTYHVIFPKTMQKFKDSIISL